MRRFLLFVLFFILILNAHAQPLVYVSGQSEALFAGLHESYTPNQTTLQKFELRLRTGIYLSPSLGFHAAFDNRAYTGQALKDYPGYSFFSFNPYLWLDMKRYWKDDAHALAFSRVDQLYGEYNANNFTIRAGRQLIAWGQTIIWNVNDIFNTYTLFDLDNPIRQGSDAIRISYASGPASVVELAARLNNYNELTAAVMSRFDLRGMEVQLQGGLVDNDDLMLGAALVRAEGRLGLRSEAAWFVSIADHATAKPTLLLAAGADYVFPGGLILQAEVLYNSLHDNPEGRLLGRLYGAVSSPKARSFSEWSLAANATYSVSNRVRMIWVSGWFPDYKGYHLSPSVQIRLTGELSARASAQYFSLFYLNERQRVMLGMAGLQYGF